MRNRTPAQMRRQMLRRPRSLPELLFDEAYEEAINAQIRRNAQNRMVVFDAAPRDVRDRTNLSGDSSLERWWESLDEWQQVSILEGRGCPLPRHVMFGGILDRFESLW